jgi:hypothetical protein
LRLGFDRRADAEITYSVRKYAYEDDVAAGRLSFINEMLQNSLVLCQNWLLPIASADLFGMSLSGGTRMNQDHRSHHELPSLDAIQVRGCVCVNPC